MAFLLYKDGVNIAMFIIALSGRQGRAPDVAKLASQAAIRFRCIFTSCEPYAGVPY
jgi:hypothetical protein